ncbi:MAG: peptidylprolyl isomerase [Bacteroidales bacterium]
MKKVLLILWLFLTAGTAAFAQGYIIDRIIATVGKQMVKQSDIEMQYQQMRRSNMDANIDIRCYILEQLLIQKLLVTQAEIDSVEIEASSVELMLNEQLGYYMTEFGTRDNLEKAYGKSYSEIREELKEAIKERRTADKMQQEITKDVTITPTEVRQWFNKLNADSVPVIPGKISIAQIAMYPPFEAKTITEVREKLLGLRKRILDGEAFSSMAIFYSEDGSASNGGEIGFSQKTNLDPEYAKAAWALKPGEVSRIVESQFGFHIIQLIERKGDLCNTRHILLKPKPDAESIRKAMERLDSVAMFIRADTLRFEEAASIFSEEKNSRYNGGLMVNLNRESPDFGSTWFTEKELDAADRNILATLKPGEISAPFASKDEKGRLMFKIIRIGQKTESHKANPRDDYNMLQDLALANKKQRIFFEWLKTKVASNHVKIDPAFQNCNFEFSGWIQ